MMQMPARKGPLERLFDYLYHKEPQRIPEIVQSARAEYRKLCEDLSTGEKRRLSFIRSLLDYCDQERWGMALNQLEPAEEEYHRHFVSRMRTSSKQGYYQLHGKEVYKSPPDSAPQDVSGPRVTFKNPHNADVLVHDMSKASVGPSKSQDNPPLVEGRSTSSTTRVAESFKQLKQNEWANAVKEMELLKMDEESVATCLLRIVLDAYRLCKLEAENQISKMEQAIHEIMMEGTHHSGEIVKGKRSCLVEYRKSVSAVCTERLQESFMRRFLPEIIRSIGVYQNIRTHGPVHEFSNQCVLTCWRMVVEDPPMYLHDDRDKMALFNHDLYQPYKRDGQSVAYYVWPALKTSKNGALLAKGIAQGR